MTNTLPNATPSDLSVLLESGDISLRDVMGAAGVSRYTVWRWRTGASFPNRVAATALSRAFGDRGLTFEGCYRVTTSNIKAQESAS